MFLAPLSPVSTVSSTPEHALGTQSVTAHISAKHRQMVVPFIEQLAALAPQALPFQWQGAQHITMPHTTEHVRLARNFGIRAVPPVLSYYDWHDANPPPFDAQRQTVAMLSMEKRAYVLNAFGTGKTRAALWGFDWLRQEGLVKRMLVSAPLSTLHLTWAHQAFAVVPHLKVNVLYGTRDKRLKLLAEPADIYVINHDGIGIIMGELIARKDIDLIVLDELAVYRNGTSQRFKQMAKILPHKTRVWGMTGSPTPNAPTDAWAQAKLVTPWTAPTGFVAFRDQTMLKVSNFKWVAKPSALRTVQDTMQPSVRYTLDDVAELPELIVREVPVTQGPRQIAAYTQLEKHLHALFSAGELTVMNSGVLMNKLLQISLGYVYTNDRGVEAFDNDDRLDALLDDIEATNEKVIVFVSFIHALDGVSAHLKKNKIDHDVVSGATSKPQRDKIFYAFQNNVAPRVLVAHPACMSHGLTLTAASTIIWLGPIASLETFEQANARITRVGQKHKQQVLLFSGTKVESKLYQRLRQKQGVQDTLLEMFRADTVR